MTLGASRLIPYVLAGIVGLNRFGLDKHRRVAPLGVLALARNRTRNITRTEKARGTQNAKNDQHKQETFGNFAFHSS